MAASAPMSATLAVELAVELAIVSAWTSFVSGRVAAWTVARSLTSTNVLSMPYFCGGSSPNTRVTASQVTSLTSTWSPQFGRVRMPAFRR
jgi:hypothetical protein